MIGMCHRDGVRAFVSVGDTVIPGQTHEPNEFIFGRYLPMENSNPHSKGASATSAMDPFAARTANELHPTPVLYTPQGYVRVTSPINIPNAVQGLRFIDINFPTLYLLSSLPDPR